MNGASLDASRRWQGQREYLAQQFRRKTTDRRDDGPLLTKRLLNLVALLDELGETDLHVLDLGIQKSQTTLGVGDCVQDSR